ncbi:MULTISPECIES: GNAT family N-acetyltransferase [Faecalicatena]|nr:GNAT family N-acetyltransferase [Faecalicatena contorta]
MTEKRAENTTEKTTRKMTVKTTEKESGRTEERFEIRLIRRPEVREAAEAERLCFPPNEAGAKEVVRDRAFLAGEQFLVAVDRETGKIAGYLNGLVTEESTLRDEFFKQTELHDPRGVNVMILSLGVLPEYRRQGLASELMACYVRQERERGRRMLVLTCLEEKVEMYRKMGFEDKGMSQSCWGGESWHEMTYIL